MTDVTTKFIVKNKPDFIEINKEDGLDKAFKKEFERYTSDSIKEYCKRVEFINDFVFTTQKLESPVYLLIGESELRKFKEEVNQYFNAMFILDTPLSSPRYRAECTIENGSVFEFSGIKIMVMVDKANPDIFGIIESKQLHNNLITPVDF